MEIDDYIKGDTLQYILESWTNGEKDDSIESEIYTVQNTAPEMQSVSVSSPITLASIVTSSANASDIDGDSLPGNYEYDWEYRENDTSSGILVSQAIGQQLDISEYSQLHPGMDIRSVVKVTDGEIYSDSISSNWETIINAFPVATYSQLIQTATGLSLEYIYYDEDNVSEISNQQDPDITCFQNGVEFYQGSETEIPVGSLSENDAVYCTFTLSDDLNY
ncbi:MAG: hypothetical protein U9Q15_02095, partial [Patescibacteria group bacterium]|nr:hypothetical protein [Patescibacteria group bacterium]